MEFTDNDGEFEGTRTQMDLSLLWEEFTMAMQELEAVTVLIPDKLLLPVREQIRHRLLLEATRAAVVLEDRAVIGVARLLKAVTRIPKADRIIAVVIGTTHRAIAIRITNLLRIILETTKRRKKTILTRPLAVLSKTLKTFLMSFPK